MTSSTESKDSPKMNGDQDSIPLVSIVPSFLCPICGDLFVDAHTIKDCVHTCLIQAIYFPFILRFVYLCISLRCVYSITSQRFP